MMNKGFAMSSDMAPYRMIRRIPLFPPFFLQKNGERSRTCHGVARRAKTEGFTSLFRQVQFHIFTRRQPLFTQNRRFSSLPRRNAMKPGHLHQAPEKTYLLVHRSLVRRWMKSLPMVACEDIRFAHL